MLWRSIKTQLEGYYFWGRPSEKHIDAGALKLFSFENTKQLSVILKNEYLKIFRSAALVLEYFAAASDTSSCRIVVSLRPWQHSASGFRCASAGCLIEGVIRNAPEKDMLAGIMLHDGWTLLSSPHESMLRIRSVCKLEAYRAWKTAASPYIWAFGWIKVEPMLFVDHVSIPVFWLIGASKQ